MVASWWENQLAIITNHFVSTTNISDVMADAAIFRTNFSDPKMESLKKEQKGIYTSSFASTMISFAVFFTLIKDKRKANSNL